jgi:hypothetical protein
MKAEQHPDKVCLNKKSRVTKNVSLSLSVRYILYFKEKKRHKTQASNSYFKLATIAEELKEDGETKDKGQDQPVI